MVRSIDTAPKGGRVELVKACERVTWLKGERGNSGKWRFTGIGSCGGFLILLLGIG